MKQRSGSQQRGWRCGWARGKTFGFFCFQELHRQLCTHKALLQASLDRMKTKFSDAAAPVPLELQSLLQEVQQPLQEVEAKVRQTGCTSVLLDQLLSLW